MNTTTMTTWFAAVGNDGLRPVVWGLGHTAGGAIEDALAQDGIDEGIVAALAVHPITAEQAAKVEAGDVSWPITNDECPYGRPHHDGPCSACTDS